MIESEKHTVAGTKISKSTEPESAISVPYNSLKTFVVERLLPLVQTPAQYIGGELNAVKKSADSLRGTVCLVFPDLYSIGMSNHGLQVLYDIMNRVDGWLCERAFCPMPDMERLLRETGTPLWSLETFRPLAQFDVLGFTLQYDLCYSNVLTILDLGRIPLLAENRTLEHPLVIAGGPCTANPEPMSRFIDIFIIGDGEHALREVCELWLKLKNTGKRSREEILAEMAARLPYIYVPRFYRVAADGRVVSCRSGLPDSIEPAILEDLDAVSPPRRPVVPYIECVQDRMAIEIMRGCPGRCRFCQSTTLKRPLRFRKVDSILAAAMDQYRATGYNEISLLSLSSSDYPQFNDLVSRLQGTFRPLGVAVSLPSLRINEQLCAVGELLTTDKHSGLTLAPEVARDDMRRFIGKPITNEDLYAGCRKAFERGFSRVKLYFMCGFPGERESDLTGIIEMAENIARLGKQLRGKPIDVVVNVSNFVPKPQTPFQWYPMQRREYFSWAHDFLYRQKRLRNVQLKCHNIETSLLEAVLCRGDRSMGVAIELAWRSGARLDAWNEHLRAELWWQSLASAGVDVEKTIHTPRSPDEPLPWQHISIRQGHDYLEREYQRAEKEKINLA